MKTAQEEEYVFYRLASGDMLSAQHSLKKVAQYKKDDPRRAFYEQAVLSYCRPFKACKGKFGVYKLTKSFIPEGYIAVHNELIKYRDQAFAHSDLTIRKPKLAKWRTDRGSMFPIAFRSLRIDELIKRRSEFKSLIEIVINRIYQQTETLETWLP